MKRAFMMLISSYVILLIISFHASTSLASNVLIYDDVEVFSIEHEAVIVDISADEYFEGRIDEFVDYENLSFVNISKTYENSLGMQITYSVNAVKNADTWLEIDESSATYKLGSDTYDFHGAITTNLDENSGCLYMSIYGIFEVPQEVKTSVIDVDILFFFFDVDHFTNYYYRYDVSDAILLR